MIIEGNKLTPSDGYAYVTNGAVTSDCVWLGVNDSPNNWHDTNEPPDIDPIDDSEALNIITGGDGNDAE